MATEWFLYVMLLLFILVLKGKVCDENVSLCLIEEGGNIKMTNSANFTPGGYVVTKTISL